MLTCLILYILLLAVIGIIDSVKIKNFDDFSVAGRRQPQYLVVMSLMATMIGASATIGVMGRVSSIGFPAFWWLAVGSIGLFLQAILLSEKVRELEANTLPDLVDKLVGKPGSIIVGLIIIIAWPGIVASQILAMSSILSIMTGKANNKQLMAIVAIVVIVYTMIGGQLSVIKTDAIQFVIIGAAFVATFIYLFFFGNGDNELVLSGIEAFNGDYTVKDFFIQLFIVGGTYLLGPDVMSRNLVSKDGKTAKRAAVVSGLLLLGFAFMIVLIGLWIINNVSDLNGVNPLIYIIEHKLPKPIGILLAIGLLSTLLSSADTCLVNISSIIEKDVLRRNKVLETRIFVAVIGVIALFIAFFKGDIITMLTGAYSIYAPGVVCPLFIAIVTHKKRKLNKLIWILAVVAGGSCGFINTYINSDLVNLPIIGMGISLILGVISVL